MDNGFIIAFIVILLIVLYLFIINIFIKLKNASETINKLYFNISKINSIINNINEQNCTNYELIKINADNIRKSHETLQYYIDYSNINKIDNIKNELNTICKDINSVLRTNNDIVKLIDNNTNIIMTLVNTLKFYIKNIKFIKSSTDIILLNVDNNVNILKKIISKLDTNKPNCKDRVHTPKKVKAKNSLSNSKAEQTINDNNKK